MKSKVDKQKALLQIGGVFVFLTVVALFFIIGAEFGGDTDMVEESASSGLNTNLPDPDDVYASRGKLEAVRKEQSRVDMERNRRLAQNSSFDMLNSLNAPKKEEVEPVDVDKLLGNAEEIQPAELEVSPEPEHAKQVYKSSASRASSYASSRPVSDKAVQPAPKTKSMDDEERMALRVASAKRRVDRHIGTHEDSLLLGLAMDYEEERSPNAADVSFNNLGGKQQQTRGKTQISAVIHGEQKNVRTSSQVKLRLLEPVMIGGVMIPKNTFVFGKITFGDSRVEIQTENIRYNGEIFSFNGNVYDKDGRMGLFIGDNLANEMKTESEKDVLSENESYYRSSNTNFISNVGRTVKRGTQKVLEKRQRLDKVDLPANYEVYIDLRR